MTLKKVRSYILFAALVGFWSALMQVADTLFFTLTGDPFISANNMRGESLLKNSILGRGCMVLYRQS